MDESFLPEEQQNIEVIEKEKIRISVRNLVEFVFRSGDIDNRVGKVVQRLKRFGQSITWALMSANI